jgi:poly-gamma-glutamate synthesis protein (capsule biosynthesis protein)
MRFRGLGIVEQGRICYDLRMQLPHCESPRFRPSGSGALNVEGLWKESGVSARCLFAGDWASIRMHADAAERDPVEVYGAELLRRIRAADLAVVNLESATGGDKAILKDGPNLQGPPESAAALKRAGFHLATLANNHVYDYGETGLLETLAHCGEAGLEVCGAGRNLKEAMRPWVWERNGQRIGILNLCDLEEGAADWDKPGTASIHHPHMRDFVREARASVDALVLVVHGGREYVPVPPPYWRDAVLAAGGEADLVVGHHPHVPQGMTLLVREGGVRVPVIFSTGNFLFRPAAPVPGWIPPRTGDGYVVEAGFADGALTRLELVPYRIEGEAGPRLSGDLASFQAMLEGLSAPLTDAGDVEAWFNAVADHFWEQEVRERLRGLTEKACSGDREAMRHAVSHHHSPAHTTLIHRAMEREMNGLAGTAPACIQEQIAGWFSGFWPAMGLQSERREHDVVRA